MAKNNSKRVVVKKVGPIRRFFSITGAILTTAVVAGGTAMAIPQSRDAIGDWMAAHFSPEYKQVSEQKDTLSITNDMYADQVTKLQTNISTATTEKTALETQLAAKTAEATQLQTQLTAKTVELEQLQAQLTAKTAEVTQLQTQLAAKTTEITQLETQLETAQAEANQLQAQIDALQQQINTLQATVDSFEQVNITFANSWVSDYNSIIQSIIIHDNLTNRDYTITNTNFNTSPGVSVYSWQSVTFTFNNGIEASASTVYPDEYPITVTPGATGNIITVSGAPRAAIDITLTEVETITAIKNGETSQVNIVNGIVQGDDITSYDRLIINKNLKNFSIDTTMPQDNFLYYDGKYNDLATAIIDRSMNIQVPSNHYLIMRDLQTEKPTAYFINNGQSIFVGHFRADNPGKWSGGYSLFSTNYTLLSKGVMFTRRSSSNLFLATPFKVRKYIIWKIL